MTEAKYGILGVWILAFISPSLCVMLTVSRGQTVPPVELVCTDAADGVKLKWYFNGTDLTARPEWQKEFTIFENNKTLRLLKVDQTTVGPSYQCRHTNETLIKIFDLTAKPYIKPYAKGKNVIQGDPLSIDCLAWGIPYPAITWMFNNSIRLVPDNNPLITLKNSTAGVADRFPVLENSTMRMERVDYKDGGVYTCFATVVIDGQEYITNATLLVQVKDKYAALWPFLGICVEVTILCVIILVYEKRRAKRIAEEDRLDEAQRLNVPSDTKTPINEDVRQRK